MPHRKKQIEYLLNKLLRNFDKTVLAIPDSGLKFRATDANMTTAEMAYHVYQVCYLLTCTIKFGRYHAADLEGIEFNPEKIKSSTEIYEYGQKVRQFMDQTFSHIAEDVWEKPVAFRKNFTAEDVLTMMIEEVIHHRGQLVIYLRLQGIVPPGIYSY